MLGKKPNKVYDPHLKAGLGFENSERLKKAIEAQPNMYDGEKLKSNKLKFNLPDYEETLEDIEKKIFVEQTYFLSPSTSNVSFESSSEKSDLPPKKMPNKSKLLKLFVNLDKEIKDLGKLININLKMDQDSSFIYDNKVGIKRLFTHEVIQIVLWIVDSGFLKHMTRNLKLLRSFIDKFIGIVRFENDHFAVITVYGDYVQGNLTICHVYYVESIGHNLFSVGQFCDGDLEVAFCSNTCYIGIWTMSIYLLVLVIPISKPSPFLK
ncbi:hypothetical protein Tco_0608468 [Tanacetum coccineum]